MLRYTEIRLKTQTHALYVLLITIHFPLFYGVSFLYQTRKMLYLVITSNLSCLSWFICSERQSIDFLTWIHPWVFVRSVLHNHRIVRVVFCRSLFVFVLFVFLWQLYCLSFFNICYLVTSLTSFDYDFTWLILFKKRTVSTQ
jgi:hypothetical protein